MILFYTATGPYGCFCNFSPHSFTYGTSKSGPLHWPTSEHAFQAMKFFPHRMDLITEILSMRSPKQAAEFGRDRRHPIRQDWESWHGLSCFKDIHDPRKIEFEPAIWRVKDMMMYMILKEKFGQNPEIASILTLTEVGIVEDSNIDSYWGWGADHIGQNKLGRILMIVRNDLKNNKK